VMGALVLFFVFLGFLLGLLFTLGLGAPLGGDWAIA